MKPNATAHIMVVLNWPFSVLQTHEEEVKAKITCAELANNWNHINTLHLSGYFMYQ